VTLKALEEREIITPHRRRGERVYNEEQVADIIFALDLRREMGVNWPGVDVALQMRRNMRRMTEQVEEIFNYVRENLEGEFPDKDTDD
jgi:DNA-binding transcriptional MerR regulator